MGRRVIRKQAFKRAVFFYGWNAFVVATVVVLACGKQSGLQSEPAVPFSNKPLTMAVFSKLGDSATDSPLAGLGEALEHLSAAEREEVDVRLYVTGADITQAQADAHREALGIVASAVPDNGGKNFEKMVGAGKDYPALMLVDRNGESVSGAQTGATEDWNETVLQAGHILRNRITLMLFGAPWCTACKQDLPAIEKAIGELPARQRVGLRTQLYVTTDVSPSAPATQKVAEAYRNALHLEAPAFADAWRWKGFKKYVGGDLVLPGAAVLDPSNNILRAYRAGGTTFVPAEIVDFASRSIP